MSTELAARSEGRCELCGAATPLTEQAVAPKKGQCAEECVAVCATCEAASAEPTAHADHWRCLNDGMWSPVPAVQARVYRLLGALSTDWASDLKDRMYLDEATLEWADAAPTSVVHKDA